MSLRVVSLEKQKTKQKRTVVILIKLSMILFTEYDEVKRNTCNTFCTLIHVCKHINNK